MNIFTLFNQLTAMPKRLAMVLTVLFTLGVGSMLGAALEDGYEKVTDISTLSAGDRVVLYCDAISLGVTGANSNGKDATVAASDWVEYVVEAASGGVYLKDENASNYIASPGSSNVFKYGTKAVCSVDANGVLKCNNRYLCYNSTGGTYYRMYSSIGSYKPFYVYKVVTSTPVYNITVSSNDDSWGTANVSGNTITADPADCYQVKSGIGGYTIKSGTATVTHDGNSNTLTVAASSDCSIQVNFEKKPVNTYIDNVQGNEEQELCGDHNTPTLADKTQKTTGTCEQQHWHFMGWVTEANKANPNANIVKAGASVTADGTTYYAVWAKGVTSGGASTSKQYSFDITPSNFNGTSYAANNNEKTSTAKASDNSTLEVKWTSNQVMLQNNAIQWQKSKGYIYNSTDLGTINSVTVTSTAGTYTTYYGQSEQPSSGTAGDGKGYFKTSVGSATGTASKVTVTFTITTQGGQTTTYSDYITQCSTQTTITLDPNGGTGNVSTYTTEETSYTLPACPFSRTGYTFAGWAKSSNGEIEYGDKANLTNLDGTPVVLYAQWTANSYTVIFNANGGTGEMDNQSFNYDEEKALSANEFTRKGHTFVNWNNKDDGSGDDFDDEEEVKNLSTINGDTYNLYAQWECVTPTISTQPQSATYLRDDDADALSVVAAASDATLTYQWQKSTDNSAWSDITGATEETYKPSTQSVGTTYYQVVVTNSEGNCSATSDVATITVRSANCKWVETEIGDIESGDEVVVAMTKSGYTWALNSSNGTNTYPYAEQITTENQTIVSVVSDPIIWNISGNVTDGYVFYPNGSTATWLYCTGSNNTVKVGTGTAKTFYIENNYLKNTQKLTVSGVQVDAYIGVSISTSSWRHYPTTTGTSVIADQTLKLYKKECLPTGKYWINYDLTNVVCTDDPIKNKISTDDNAVELNFEATGEHNELPTTIIVTNGSTTLAKNTDYTWSNGVLTILNPSQITDNITISIAAQKRKYTVTFDANGHGTAPAAQSVTAEGTASEPTAPTATGYTFGGWYKEPECTTAFDFATPITGNITLYAKWTVNKYTITFKNYDGTELQSSEVAYGETPSYTGETPTREQTAQYTYTFKGWSPTITSVTQDQVYTAQFTQTTRQYTVTWYDGTGNAHKTQSANYNTTISVPTTDPDPCDDAYPHFIGWTADPIVGSTTTQPTLVENVKVTGDCDYYAVFAKGEGGSSNYQKVTTNLDDWSGEYLIVNETNGKAFNGSLTTLDANNNVIDVTINNNVIEASDETNSAKFTIAPYSTGYSIQSNSGKYIGETSYDNDLDESADTKYVNTISFSSGTVSIKGTGNSSGTYVALKYNSSASRFRYYKSGQSDIALYKKGSGVNYTSYITTCCTSWTAPTLTYTTPLNAETSQTAEPQLGSGTTHGNPTYTSSNPSVLAVDEETGVVTARGKGTATITVTWEGNEPYCSMSATSNTITVNGSYSVTFHSNGGTGTMEPQKADPSTQRIAKLNKNEFTKADYVFVSWKDASGVAYTDEQENITLTKNITLFAQWAPVVTLNDAGNEETAHPTAVNGTITLPDGANACPPYEFVGWTAVATGDWNEGINEPALVATTYTPNAPTRLYAVYKIQSEGNANAFKLSFEGSNGNTYYVDEYSTSPLRGYSNITKDDAVTFIKTKMYPNDDTRYYLYMEEKGEYLYYNGYFNTTSNTPSESQGWIIHTVGDKIKLQSTYSYDPKYLCFSDRDNYAINIDVNASGSEFNMLSAVTSTYVASPLCNQEIEIIFETGNGDFVDNAPATNPLTVSRGDVITLPTCEYPGYEFMGWMKDEQQLDPSDIIGTYYTGDYTVDGVSSTITFYAYYKVIPEEVEFTGKDDVELLMYYDDGTENYYYAVSHAAERGELSSKQNCFNATTWTFTNVGNMQYHIQDETGKYLGAYSDGDNDLILSATPKVWTFTEVNGLWKMVCENSPSRALMYISTGKTFTNAAKSMEGNGAYSYVTLGICPYPTYTTNPVLTQGFVVTNTAMVTSAAGQKVKATNALTLETRNIELPCTFTITAPNIIFYDNTGAEVTQLTASAASEQFELYFAYKPTAENTMEYPTITIVDDEMKTYTIKNRIYARSLPNTFAVVAKVGGIWYALPSQGLNSTDALVGYPVEVDNLADPTAVTAVPENADWSLRQVYEASRVDATKDRFVANGENFVFVNNEGTPKALNVSASGNYLLTDAQYSGYYETNPGLYEWTPTTSDLETYTLTNEQRADRTLNVSINTVFGVHYDNKATTEVRFLPIQDRYTPMAAQVVAWKENSVVVMYNGDPAQTASVSVNGGTVQTTELSGDDVQKDIAVYELAADGLATNPTQSLSITIGTEKAILPIPYIVSSETTDLALLPGTTVAARQEVAKVADLVVLKDAKLTAAGAKGNPYKFRNVTIYGGGKLVIPSDKGFGVASLTLRAGGITDAGEYDYVYPQFELRGTFTNSAAKINYDYITDYDHWFHLVLPFAGDLTTIKYPTEFYGANVAANNTGSWQIKRYAGEIRATGNYKAWVDIETDNPKPTATTPGVGYIFWGAPKKVTVNGDKQRQKWGIQRITMSVTAPNAMTAENGDKAISELSSYANVPNNSGKDNDQGWNLIGNPYMVNLTTMAEDGLKAGKLEKEIVDGNWTGKWFNNGDGIRYLTIPSNHFDTYEAKTVNAAMTANNLVPGRAFFVQLEGEANGVTFSAANRASLMPQHLAAQNTEVEIETGIILSNETMQDEVNFWIKDGKTNDYEYNADYPKTPNNTNFNIYGVHINGDLSWVAVSPEIAEESMPIGYQVPAAGTYTLSISETYYSDILDALYVTDHAMSPELTVDLMNAPYEFSVNQAETNNERFTVSVRLKSENQGPTTGVNNTGAQRDGVTKFIYQDKMFILHNGIIYDATGKKVTTINK